MGGNCKGHVVSPSGKWGGGAIEGRWGADQIFLGFEIDTISSGIRTPEKKRAGASVLFDELFLSFGSHALRITTLRRILGDIEHFKSANTLW